MKVVFRCAPALQGLLPRPVPAREALPEWLRRMPPRAHSELHERAIRTVKQCPPFVDAMSQGFCILLPCDVRVSRGCFSWDWELPPLGLDHHPASPLSFHVPAQLSGSPFASEGRSALKFNSFWTIELEAGHALLAMHPVNRPDLPFRTFTGLVDADRFVDAGINFPALWNDPDFEGVLPRGTPVAQCVVLRREALELQFEAFDEVQAQRYEALVAQVLAEPGVYRKQFRVKP
ncbi:MAG: hypothetical protein JOY84_02120 [Curvibacter sp.]|nr:hypothetical protein [Curvibacter sp.]